jgi:hypothetical protein
VIHAEADEEIDDKRENYEIAKDQTEGKKFYRQRKPAIPALLLGSSAGSINFNTDEDDGADRPPKGH